MNGSENETNWFDYDLVSEYTTGMAHMTLLDYYNGAFNDPNEVGTLTNEQLLDGYLNNKREYHMHNQC